ncbi:ion transporter [Saccharobesus litoralis]|uniref:Ion transporter n=1 Tax=Saccharobesus litoralis TaxID=2172099 RepID=A0A2S0VQB5_9ALTE|nr:ion transporter [Saccharobesus litoralis]AWB66389.1 ion transporter [Saccharobesus litoralis]
MNESRSPLYNLVLVFLSIYVLSALVVESFFISDPEVKRVLQFIDLIVCVIFLSDFFYCLLKAESKKRYLKWGWIDFVSSIPAIDPLRWGRISKLVRIIRYLRAIKSIKILISSLHASKYETLSLCIFLIVFVSFTLSSAFILEFERHYDSSIDTAEAALWWAFLNIMNAKASINQALSAEGVFMTTILNKVGLILFAYFNSMLIAWLVVQKQQQVKNQDVVVNEEAS